MNCELCNPSKETVLWSNPQCRVILVDDKDYPGFCRVILNQHVREMTDLPPSSRNELMNIVFMVEAGIRQVLNPDKINLASLGNVVPHLHWHVIPRFRHDKHFPNPIWGSPQRETAIPAVSDLQAQLTAYLEEKLAH
jgi:diadenosine tetraphosphate (Ap4A) HIT family hydrolase